MPDLRMWAGSGHETSPQAPDGAQDQTPLRDGNLTRLEIAVDNAMAVRNAAEGGADRLELCASLADGGLTPSLGFIEWTLQHVSIPVHCMLRPRPGNFVYQRDELAAMERDLRAMREAGVQGVVVGVLTGEQRVDVPVMRRLRELAGPMRLCFHRAFDVALDRAQALEDVIACGADILLTSGGAPSLYAGAAEIRRIARQSAGRLELMGGAGVRLNNARELWQTLPVDTLHASLRSPWPEAGGGASGVSMGARDEDELYTVRAEDVRVLRSLLAPREAAIAR